MTLLMDDTRPRGMLRHADFTMETGAVERCWMIV